jgi:Holliday junction resolvase-like predicted endonuclease
MDDLMNLEKKLNIGGRRAAGGGRGEGGEALMKAFNERYGEVDFIVSRF